MDIHPGNLQAAVPRKKAAIFFLESAVLTLLLLKTITQLGMIFEISDENSFVQDPCSFLLAASGLGAMDSQRSGSMTNLKDVGMWHVNRSLDPASSELDLKKQSLSSSSELEWDKSHHLLQS